jgi:ethanolamine permease
VPNRELDAIVNEVVADAHISRDLILPEEISYIREHVLRKPLRVIHVWALGVGVVITGLYFGWNFGLPLGGPIGVLLATLVVCVLYLAWVLSLSELSVAMPFAGGPMAYGRRALGRLLGFIMGWSMFLESLFAAIGTALAAGAYVAFLFNPINPNLTTATVAGVACTVVFCAIQYIGVKEQAEIMLWLTYAAIFALVWFWFAAAPGVRLERIFTHPLLLGGWRGVVGAIPYALWFLVIIETVALASEEAHEPHISIPRGLVFAQVTLVILVIVTGFFAAGAAPIAQTGAVDYPLPLVIRNVWGRGLLVTAFSAVALAGMVVSYNGMIYATSRQAFSLGRAGYLPKVLGMVHPTRRIPHVSLVVWTVVAIAFIIFGHYFANATAVAILISTLTAVIWYALAVICLVVLRRKEPGLFRPYRVPIYPWLPVFVAVLSVIAGCVYAWANVKVILPTACLYTAAATWYFSWSRQHVLPVAPEEVAARIAHELAAHHQPSALNSTRDGANGPAGSPLNVSASCRNKNACGYQAQAILECMTVPMLLVGVVSLGWMLLRSSGARLYVLPESVEVIIFVVIWSALFILIGAVGLLSTWPKREDLGR